MISNNKFYLCSDPDTTMDDNYRYQIQVPLFSFASKKGKPVTTFDNCEQFSTALQIESTLLIKCIAAMLSCSSSDNTFKGRYSDEEIILCISSIVTTYLLCKNCDRPEVDLKKSKGCLRQKCRACGHKNYIEFLPSKVFSIFIKHYSS